MSVPVRLPQGVRARNGAAASLSALPLFLFILLLPLSDRLTSGHASWTTVTLYDWQRIGQLAAFSLVILFFLKSEVPARGEVPSRRSIFLLTAVLLYGGLSVLVNQIPIWDGLHEIALLSSAILACWAVWSGLAAGDEDRWQGIACLFLSGSALLYLAVFFDRNADVLYSSDPLDPAVKFLAFSNIRFFSDYQMLLFPFLVHVASFCCRNKVARVCAWLMVWLFAMLFFYTGSRVVILGQAGVHLYLAVVLRRRYLPTLARHALAWAGGYLSYQLSALLSSSAAGVGAMELMREGLSHRDVIWALAWENILHSPWLGIGPGEFARQLNPVAAGPHNSLLMIAAEWGVPVLLATSAALSLMLVRSMRGLRSRAQDESRTSDFAIAAWQAFGALLLHSMVANVLVVPTSLASLVLASAIVCATTLSPVPALEVATTNSPRLLRGMLVLGTVATIAALLIRDVPQLPGRNQAQVNCKKPTEFFSPRFWQQGWLIDSCPSTTVLAPPGTPAMPVPGKTN